MTPEVFFCTCGNYEHQVIIASIDDFNDDETLLISVGTSLCDNLSFWQRVKCAIKFIFGFRSNYGMFAETLLTREETLRLISVLNNAIKREVPDVPN
jgi:hypothetical protein